MTVTAGPAPPAAQDFAGRMERAADQAAAAGLTGILVAPGPDLLYRPATRRLRSPSG
jgi:hypothetical protein